MEEEKREQIENAVADHEGHTEREAVCRTLADTFRAAGDLLWPLGALIGPDRRDEHSPYQFGSDTAVGLAIIVQIGAELLAGACDLLEADNLYGASALLRQLVEIEYLAWAFAENEAQAMTWLRATPEQRRKEWKPGDLRARSKGRFGDEDYWRHCEQGGHPTFEATVLLPNHSRRVPSEILWCDLAQHGTSTWRYALGASRHTEHSEIMLNVIEKTGLPSAIERWRETDPLIPLLGTL